MSRADLGADIGASLVVFLVALPLCVGIAVASGVPAELGIVTGVVGGLVVGLLPGSTMQVSGPAAGLTVIVAEAVSTYGLASLGIIVLGAGLLQLLMGLCRLGTWFRAISPTVVQGMLAGIGLVLILGQVYPAAGLEQPATTPEKFADLARMATVALTTPAGLGGLAVGVLTVMIIVFWGRLPGRLRLLPGPLVGVLAASAVAVGFGLPLQRIEVGSLLESVNVPELAALDEIVGVGLLGSIVTFAFVASAESLFSAAALDKMHDKPRTRYNTELVAQGIGNTVCGALGALPMTAVIVRSSANVRAGARSRASRVLHGVWLLLFAAALPGVLSFIPAAVLAALLIHAGWKLLEVRNAVSLARSNRAEFAVFAITAGTIVGTDLLIGTVVGLAAAIIKMAWEVSHLTINHEHDDDKMRVRLSGTATFLRLPKLQDALEQLPPASHVHLDLTPVRHLDHACQQVVETWAKQRRRADCHVEVAMPATAG